MKWMLAVLAVALVGAGSPGFAADQPTPESGTPAPAVNPDKGVYTLWNPTPSDQMRDMDTDRPNKTNTPHTIDAGHLQVETGPVDSLYFRDKSTGADARTQTWSLGQFNLRLGVLNNLEVNAGVTSYVFQHFHDNLTGQTSRQSGLGDTIVGGKLNLWGNDGADGAWATALGIQPQVKLPTARRDLGTGHTEVVVGVPFSLNLPGEVHLGLQTTPGWVRNADNTGYVTGWQNSITVDRVFFTQWDVYAEYWSQVTTERHREGQGTVDLGVIYQMTRNLSWDTGVNLGINKSSPTVEWTVGVSLRY